MNAWQRCAREEEGRLWEMGEAFERSRASHSARACAAGHEAAAPTFLSTRPAQLVSAAIAAASKGSGDDTGSAAAPIGVQPACNKKNLAAVS